MAGYADRRAFAGLVAAIALGAGMLASAPGEPASARGELKLKRVGGFDAPVYVADAPGARDLLFVVEQPGTVRVVRDGRTLARPFLNIRDQVRYGGEQGLLSIAFDPDYEHNRRFFVYYVTTGGDIRVDLMRRKKRSATRAEPSSRRKLIEIPHPTNENHNGGQLQFGPDGSLFLATGDGGGAGDPKGNAQDRNSLLGKLLRIDPRRNGGYSTPSSNPFSGGAGEDEIYALGLRNPYRFSFDRKTGDLLIGDVGQNDWEEIDHVGFDAARGANFGWVPSPSKT
jgi:glucose/arabinose dehydrogenase